MVKFSAICQLSVNPIQTLYLPGYVGTTDLLVSVWLSHSDANAHTAPHTHYYHYIIIIVIIIIIIII